MQFFGRRVVGREARRGSPSTREGLGQTLQKSRVMRTAFFSTLVVESRRLGVRGLRRAGQVDALERLEFVFQLHDGIGA
jgi:hypothetical protein